MKPSERRLYFEALVLQCLWCIIRLQLYTRRAAGGPGSHYDLDTPMLRAKIIGYFDHWGNKSPDAPGYRRTKTFPEMGQEP